MNLNVIIVVEEKNNSQTLIQKINELNKRDKLCKNEYIAKSNCSCDSYEINNNNRFYKKNY